MKNLFLMLTFVSLLYSGERRVLVEMFTNSHCTVCPGAHAAINSFRSTSANANRVRYIFYHTTFPYSDDQLSIANTTEPNARNTYYNGPSSTPNTFFDGVNQGRTYSSFSINLESRLAVSTPLNIDLTGTKSGQTISVTASVSQTENIVQNDLVIHMVVVENVTYVGRNGVSPQNFVMRKMITPIAGDPLIMDEGLSKLVSRSATLTNITSINNVGVVVFVQSVSTKEVYQSEYISYSTLTDVEQNEPLTPLDVALQQNYPNPFNPSTSITFSLPRTVRVSLKVFDLLGNEVAILVNQTLGSGQYTFPFNAAEFYLSSGVYFYRLESGGKAFVRKMTVLQ
ncbi:MAG: Omp28-related outer membrane protein [Bacteroidota bacterium]